MSLIQKLASNLLKKKRLRPQQGNRSMIIKITQEKRIFSEPKLTVKLILSKFPFFNYLKKINKVCIELILPEDRSHKTLQNTYNLQAQRFKERHLGNGS